MIKIFIINNKKIKIETPTKTIIIRKTKCRGKETYTFTIPK